jgi:hypothetical protein
MELPISTKPSVDTIRFEDTKPKAKLTYLRTSMLVAILVSLIPTGQYRNLGYVDPNMYLGYGANLTWLASNVGFEYHATRLPLIFLIKMLLLFPPELFGYLFKLICLFIVSISWFFLCKNLRITFNKSLLGSLVILMSPLCISASSWTFANSFSAIICCLILPLVTKEKLNHKDLFGIGILITNIAVLNVFFAFLMCIVVAVFLFEKSVSASGKAVFWISIGIFIMWLVYESIWSLLLGLPRSIWFEQYKALTSINRWENEYWQPISVLLNDKNYLLNFLSFIVLGIVTSSLLIFGARGRFIKERCPRAPIAVLILSVTLLMLYFAKSFIGFTEFFYYYVVLMIHILVLTSLLSSRIRTLNALLPAFMLFFTFVFYLKWQIDYNPNYAALSLVLASILIFIGSHLLVKYIKVKSHRSPLSSFGLMAIYVFGSSLLFLNPSFGNAYLSNDNSRNTNFLKAQIEFIGYAENLNFSNQGTALWTGADTTMILGGLESTLGYHLIRLDGLAPSSYRIDVTNWEKSRGRKPESILILLRSDDFEKVSQSKESILDVVGYCIEEEKSLPSANAIVLFLKSSQENLGRIC